MKEFKLSTAAERTAGVIFVGFVIAIFGLLLYSLRHDVLLLVFSALGVLIISALLVIYVRGVLRATAVVDAEKKLLHIRGVRDETVDVSSATLLQTFARKNAQSTVRVMVFSDADERVVATIPTMFTFRQGIWADPVAKQIAAELGIGFQQNVPDWQLDKQKYQEHLKEETEREKQEAKERRQKKMQRRIQKYKKQK